MKKLLGVLLSLSLVFSLAACSNDEEPVVTDTPDTTDNTDTTVEEDEFEVALLVPGAVNDGGWSQSAYEGLLAIEEELGATIKYTENVTSSNAEKVMSDYARAGVDMIIGHGMEYLDPAQMIQDDFEDTAFVITSTQSYSAPNIASIWVNVAEMGFITGYMAYQTGAEQFIYFEGAPYTAIVVGGWGNMAGFEYAAAEDGNTNIKTEYVSMNNTSDVQAAESLVLTMAESADWDASKLAIVANADDATRGAILAAEELQIPFQGFYASKQEESDWVMMDALSYNTKAFVAVAQTVLDGTFTGMNYNLGIADGVVEPTPIYDTYAGGDIAGLQAKLDALVAKLAAGEIDTPKLAQDWADANGKS